MYRSLVFPDASVKVPVRTDFSSSKERNKVTGSVMAGFWSIPVERKRT
jgi:hypothetical protein